MLRLTIISLRNKKVLIAKSMQFIALGIIACFVFMDLNHDSIGIRDRVGLLLLGAIMSVMSATTSAITVCNTFKFIFSQ